MSLQTENGILIEDGTGSPEGVWTAPVGSIYQRIDGGPSTTLYVKEAGAGNTGWVAYGAAGGGTTHNLLSATHPDTGEGTPALGDTIYRTSAPLNWVVLPGNITAVKQFLTGTGDTVNAGIPTWAAIAHADIKSVMEVIGSPALGDMLYRGVDPFDWNKLSGNITTAKMHLTQVGDGANSAAPVWEAIPQPPDVYEDGASVIAAATRHDFKDLNVETPSGTLADIYLDLRGTCEGRLTLTTGVAVTTSDVTAAGTLYFAQYHGSRIALYDGTRWKLHRFTERSLALALTSAKNYDVFIWDNAGTLTLELSAAWTTDAARADALVLQDGVYVKSGATTRRWLGTIRASGTNTTEDSLLKRFVSNTYNRVARPMRAVEATGSWTYTILTWRQVRATATNQVEYVDGMGENPVTARALSISSSSGGYNFASPGIGVDSTSANAATIYHGVAGAAAHETGLAYYQGYPGIGYHRLVWLEIADTAFTTTWVGNLGGIRQAGLTAEVMA